MFLYSGKTHLRAKFLPILFVSLYFIGTEAQNFDEVVIKTTKISDQIFFLEGSGGNIGVSVGVDGALMIDSQFAPLSEKIQKAIKELTDRPIEILLNTHWHGDHTGGNAHFSNQGAMIVAHENVNTRMSEIQTRPFGRDVPAAAELARPVITFSDQMNLKYNGEYVMLIHVDQAHTDGDIFVYFPESNVLHMGDVYFNGRYPYIDLASGGSIDGMIEAVEKGLFIAGENTVIIPGHGPISNRKELQKYHEVLNSTREAVQEGLDSGKSLDQIKDLKVTSATDATWGKAFISPEKFIELVFSSLTAE